MSDRAIRKKKYCRVIFRLSSPMAIGSGENEYSDRDLMRDSAGIPYIPASAVAGVCRCLLEENGENELNKYFGFVEKNTGTGNGGTMKESNLIFYDATLLKPEFHTSIRDSVSLDENKTSIKGGKFDMEVLEPGVKFQTYIEQNFYDLEDRDFIRKIVACFCRGETYFGGKSMRGYGAISSIDRDVDVRMREFDLSSYMNGGDRIPLNKKDSVSPVKSDLSAWIKFDLYADASWPDNTRMPVYGVGQPRQIDLELELMGGISIRKYTTEVKKEGSTRAVPDYMQLTVPFYDEEKETKKTSEEQAYGIPVIPGTTWAGAFRHRMHELGMADAELEDVFGKSGETKEKPDKMKEKSGRTKEQSNDVKKRSLIRFGESQIHGGEFKDFSRNAIDRFSGGTVSKALFTERIYYGGRTHLIISFEDKNLKNRYWVFSCLAAALADMHYGFLAIGGETSVGRGLFEIRSVNGKALNANQNADQNAGVYDFLYDAICSVYGVREA